MADVDGARLNAALEVHLFACEVLRPVGERACALVRSEGGGVRRVRDYAGTWDGLGFVVDAMQAKDWSLRLDVHGFGRCFAEFRSGDPGRFGPASADTAYRAVSMAAACAICPPDVLAGLGLVP